MKALRKLAALLWLLAAFVVDLFGATFAVARIVVSPSAPTRPAIVAMPTELRRPWAVAMLAYFTSLTPGATCLHVSDDRRILYLHVLDAGDPAAIVAALRRSYERPIMELER